MCKSEDSHRDKREQCPFILYCTEFFIGLGASGETETEVSRVCFVVVVPSIFCCCCS